MLKNMLGCTIEDESKVIDIRQWQQQNSKRIDEECLNATMKIQQ